MGRQIAVLELGSRIAGERKINYVGQPVPVAADEKDIKIRRLAPLPGLSGAHLQQVPYRDLLFSRISDLSSEFREEVHQLLIHA